MSWLSRIRLLRVEATYGAAAFQASSLCDAVAVLMQWPWVRELEADHRHLAAPLPKGAGSGFKRPAMKAARLADACGLRTHATTAWKLASLLQ